MNGHLCMFNQTLYPVDCTEWCIYALFINDKNQITKNCLLKPLIELLTWHTAWMDTFGL